MVSENHQFAEELFPGGYESWQYCIEVKCGLSLTPDYIEARIGILSDANHPESRRFTSLYGNSYREQVLTWFYHAQKVMKE